MSVQCKNETMEIYKTFNPLMNTLRNALLFMNVLFTAIAGFLIAAGGEITGVYNNLNSFMSLFYRLPAQLLIAVGIILVFTTCFGWFGTIKQNPLSLRLYSALLLALALTNMAVAITSFVAFNTIDSDVDAKMFEAVKKFEVDENIRRSWNYVQEEYSCCGVYFPENWLRIKSDGLNGGPLLQYRGFTRRYPYSCCVDKDCKESAIYEDGCANYIIDYVSKTTLFSACLSIILVVIQTIAAMVACSFGTRLQRCQNVQRVHKHLGKRSIVLVSPNSITQKSEFI